METIYSVGDLIKNDEIDIYYYVEKAEQEYTIRQICTDIKTTLAQEVLEASQEFLYKVGDLLQDIEGDLVLVEDAGYNPMSTVPWHYRVREFQGATYHVGKGTLENIELFKKVA